ncbi:MAG: hypothetical protein LBB29_01355 [Holosporaceae bacterium]|jgi:hypothetical protein|nr:hypothetical protein [Holosporaceae bacterium]
MIKRFLFTSYAAVMLFHASDVFGMLNIKNNVMVYNIQNSITASHLRTPMLNSSSSNSNDEKEDDYDDRFCAYSPIGTHSTIAGQYTEDDDVAPIFPMTCSPFQASWHINTNNYGLLDTEDIRTELIPLQPVDFPKKRIVEAATNTYSVMSASPTPDSGDNVIEIDIPGPRYAVLTEPVEDSWSSFQNICNESFKGIGIEISPDNSPERTDSRFGSDSASSYKGESVTMDHFFAVSSKSNNNIVESPERPDSRFCIFQSTPSSIATFLSNHPTSQTSSQNDVIESPERPDSRFNAYTPSDVRAFLSNPKADQTSNQTYNI